MICKITPVANYRYKPTERDDYSKQLVQLFSLALW